MFDRSSWQNFSRFFIVSKSIEIIIFNADPICFYQHYPNIIKDFLKFIQRKKLFPSDKADSCCLQQMENIKEFNKEVLSKNILAQKWPNQSSTVYYVSLFKQSETGLLFNERMLVVDDRSFVVFYTKHFKPLHILQQLEKKGTNPIKQRLYIMNTSIQRDENIITLNFTNEEGIKRNWAFKFCQSSLAEKWMFLYHELQEKCVSRSIKSKESKSTNISQYSSILSKLKYNNYPPECQSKDQVELQEYSKQKQDVRTKRITVKKIQQPTINK